MTVIVLFLFLNQNFKTSKEKILEIDFNLESFNTINEKEIKQVERNIRNYSAKNPDVIKKEIDVYNEAKEIESIKTEEEKPILSPTVEEEIKDTSTKPVLNSHPSDSKTTITNTHEQTNFKKTNDDVTSANTKEQPTLGEEEIQEQFLREKFLVISSIVQKNINYPLIARRMGWEGEVLVSFVIDSYGELKELKVLKSCGYEILDREVLEAVKKSYKEFPKPPVTVVIKLPVSFKLR